MKYNILYFLDYGKSFGGAANTLLQQAILMKKAGHNVLLFVSDYYGMEMESGYHSICEKSGIPIQRITYQICSHTEDIDVVCLLNHYIAVKAIVLEYKPDILHSIQINPLIELISRELKIPHIMNIYPLIPAFFSTEYLDVFPQYHICDSEYYAKKWNYYINTEYACIRTVVNTFTNKRSQFIKKNKIRFICVGSVYKQKNQLNVIKAFHNALSAGVDGNLSIYGYKDGTYGDLCQSYIVENCLEENIFMKGFCSDMLSEYAKADVLICGSTRESYPNVISEAMANRLVVISTPVAGVPEIVKDGINGYLCRDYTVEGICDKILESYGDYKSGKIDIILKNTYKTYQENHSPKVVTENLLKFYSYVVENNKETKEIRLSYVREQFTDTLYTYERNKELFTNNKFVEQKLWYIYHIKDILSEKKKNRELKYYIWGTGKYAVYVKEIIEVFFPDIMIKGYIDTYRQGYFMERKIWSPECIIKEENSIIFIGAIHGQFEMIEQLENNGKSCNNDYFILALRNW